MKKMLLLLVCLTTFAWLHADETPAYTALFGKSYNSKGISSYSETFTAMNAGFMVYVSNFNNNGSQWNDVRCGSNKAASTATITTASYVQKPISKVEIDIAKLKTGKANSASFQVSDENDFANAESFPLEINDLTSTATTLTVTIPNPAANKFYRLYIDMPKVSSNGVFSVSTLKFYEAVTTPDNQVKAPVFSHASGAIEAGEVTITCPTEGAEIYYTISMDETEPVDPTDASTPYTGAITVNKDMTIKAVAYKDGLIPSSITTATYTIKKTTVADIAEFISLAEANPVDEYAIANPVTAVYQNGQNLYVKDSSGWLLVFGSLDGKTYANGDVIAAGIKGKSQDYNGTYELSDPVTSTFADGVAGTTVEPEEVSNVSGDIVNHYVVVKGVTISDISKQNGKATTADATEIALYNKFNITGFEAGSNLTVKGFVNVYRNTTIQLIPIEITTAQGEEIVAAPTFSLAAGNVAEGTEVSIACATEGATIHYTTDGTDPDANSTVYTDPIVIDKAMTIKAIAVKEGMSNSDIVEAAYKIIVATPMFDPAPGAVKKGTEVTITCATEGAILMYQVNDDIQEGASPVTVVINEATTIEVIASKDGYVDSEAKVTYSIEGEAPANPTATFDFTQPSTLQPAMEMPTNTSPTDEERAYVDNVVFYNNYALVQFISPANAPGSNRTQLWPYSGAAQVRAYAGSTIKITVAESLTIEKIEFVGATKDAALSAIKVADGYTGTYSVNGTTATWIPAAVNALAETVGERESVVFSVTGKPHINTITITTTGIPTGVEDVTVDENAPVEYYNLQGVRVANPENGIYIRRQGSKVSKVLVK